MKVTILLKTNNVGEYVGTQIASLSVAKATIRADRPGRKLRWQREGDDICAYSSVEDMDDEDKAIARLRPLGRNTHDDGSID